MRSEQWHQRKKSDVRTRNYEIEARAQECKRPSTVTGAGETSVTYDECDELLEVSSVPIREKERQGKGVH